MPKKPPRDYLDGDIVEKIKRKGPLEMTAEDHSLIGGTPDDRLIKNPGKTLGELLNDKEILEHLEGEADAIVGIERIRPTSAETLKAGFKASLEYLERIGRLPEKFKHCKI